MRYSAMSAPSSRANLCLPPSSLRTAPGRSDTSGRKFHVDVGVASEVHEVGRHPGDADGQVRQLGLAQVAEASARSARPRNPNWTREAVGAVGAITVRVLLT